MHRGTDTGQTFGRVDATGTTSTARADRLVDTNLPYVAVALSDRTLVRL